MSRLYTLEPGKHGALVLRLTDHHRGLWATVPLSADNADDAGARRAAIEQLQRAVPPTPNPSPEGPDL